MEKTPWAVRCWYCSNGNLVFLTKENYRWQMSRSNYLWECPLCNQNASWDDTNYEYMLFWGNLRRRIGA